MRLALGFGWRRPRRPLAREATKAPTMRRFSSVSVRSSSRARSAGEAALTPRRCGAPPGRETSHSVAPRTCALVCRLDGAVSSSCSVGSHHDGQVAPLRLRLGSGAKTGAGALRSAASSSKRMALPESRRPGAARCSSRNPIPSPSSGFGAAAGCNSEPAPDEARDWRGRAALDIALTSKSPCRVRLAPCAAWRREARPPRGIGWRTPATQGARRRLRIANEHFPTEDAQPRFLLARLTRKTSSRLPTRLGASRQRRSDRIDDAIGVSLAAKRAPSARRRSAVIVSCTERESVGSAAAPRCDSLATFAAACARRPAQGRSEPADDFLDHVFLGEV